MHVYYATYITIVVVFYYTDNKLCLTANFKTQHTIKYDNEIKQSFSHMSYILWTWYGRP